MGSFPSVPSATDLEAFKTMRNKYESLKQDGRNDDSIFLALREEFISLSDDKNKLVWNKETVSESPIDSSTVGVDKKMEEENAIPVAVDTKENIQEFFRACGLFYKGKSSVNLNKAQQMYDGGLVTINCVDSDGWSALHHGCGEGHLNVVKWITGSCADVNINLPTLEECTPLWVASFNGRRDIVQHLILLGADDTVKGKPEGEPMTSPAMAARRNRKPGIADMLDTERELRSKDPSRVQKQVAKEMSMEEYRDSIREASRTKQEVA